MAEDDLTALRRKFKLLQELHDNQKKIIARLQARNLELEQYITKLESRSQSTTKEKEISESDIVDDPEDDSILDDW